MINILIILLQLVQLFNCDDINYNYNNEQVVKKEYKAFLNDTHLDTYDFQYQSTINYRKGYLVNHNCTYLQNLQYALLWCKGSLTLTKTSVIADKIKELQENNEQIDNQQKIFYQIEKKDIIYQTIEMINFEWVQMTNNALYFKKYGAQIAFIHFKKQNFRNITEQSNGEDLFQLLNHDNISLRFVNSTHFPLINVMEYSHDTEFFSMIYQEKFEKNYTQSIKNYYILNAAFIKITDEQYAFYQKQKSFKIDKEEYKMHQNSEIIWFKPTFNPITGNIYITILYDTKTEKGSFSSIMVLELIIKGYKIDIRYVQTKRFNDQVELRMQGNYIVALHTQENLEQQNIKYYFEVIIINFQTLQMEVFCDFNFKTTSLYENENKILDFQIQDVAYNTIFNEYSQQNDILFNLKRQKHVLIIYTIEAIYIYNVYEIENVEIGLNFCFNYQNIYIKRDKLSSYYTNVFLKKSNFNHITLLKTIQNQNVLYFSNFNDNFSFIPICFLGQKLIYDDSINSYKCEVYNYSSEYFELPVQLQNLFKLYVFSSNCEIYTTKYIYKVFENSEISNHIENKYKQIKSQLYKPQLDPNTNDDKLLFSRFCGYDCNIQKKNNFYGIDYCYSTENDEWDIFENYCLQNKNCFDCQMQQHCYWENNNCLKNSTFNLQYYDIQNQLDQQNLINHNEHQNLKNKTFTYQITDKSYGIFEQASVCDVPQYCSQNQNLQLVTELDITLNNIDSKDLFIFEQDSTIDSYLDKYPDFQKNPDVINISSNNICSWNIQSQEEQSYLVEVRFGKQFIEENSENQSITWSICIEKSEEQKLFEKQEKEKQNSYYNEEDSLIEKIKKAQQQYEKQYSGIPSENCVYQSWQTSINNNYSFYFKYSTKGVRIVMKFEEDILVNPRFFQIKAISFKSYLSQMQNKMLNQLILISVLIIISCLICFLGKRFLFYLLQTRYGIVLEEDTVLNEKQVKKYIKNMIKEEIVTINKYQQDTELYYKDNVTCIFCLDDLTVGNKYTTLFCNHTFHENCFQDWVKVKRPKECPICKWDFKNIKKDIKQKKNQLIQKKQQQNQDLQLQSQYDNQVQIELQNKSQIEVDFLQTDNNKNIEFQEILQNQQDNDNLSQDN